jgi:hypothetical protein
VDGFDTWMVDSIHDNDGCPPRQWRAARATMVPATTAPLEEPP